MKELARATSCDEWQRRICDALDTPAPEQDAALGKHLAGCDACSAFQQTLAALDSQLTAHAEQAMLPHDFKARLLQSATASHRLAPAEVSARREQLERAHLAALAALERRYLVPQGRLTLKVLTLTATLVLAALLAHGAVTALFDLATILREAGDVSRAETFVCLGAIAALAWWKRRSVPVFRWRLAWHLG